MEHITHHHTGSRMFTWLLTWLLILRALTLERLYRLSYLHRATHPSLPAIALVRALELSLGARLVPDTSCGRGTSRADSVTLPSRG